MKHLNHRQQANGFEILDQLAFTLNQKIEEYFTFEFMIIHDMGVKITRQLRFILTKVIFYQGMVFEQRVKKK